MVFVRGKENASARQIDAVCAVYSGFFLFIVDGKLAISAPRTAGPGAEGTPALSPQSFCLLAL